MSLRLTVEADRDIERILGETFGSFGPNQFKVYSRLIEQALERIGSDPVGLGTKEREDIGPGVRSFHLDNITRRRGSASHKIYYLPPQEGGESVTVVLRVLYQGMEPNHRVALAIADDAFEIPGNDDDDPSNTQGSGPR